MNGARVRVYLSLMMFLEFFIWGGWFVTMGTYLASSLGASGAQIGAAYSTQSWGAIIAPFFIGLLADRIFNAERLLAFLHLSGAVLLFCLARAANFATFYPYLFGYMMVYMPTLALVNAIAFRQLADPATQFAKIRVWGTLGWIVVGLLISFVFSWDSSESIAVGALRNTFLMCSVASLLLAVFSLMLPKTPPAATGVAFRVRDAFGWDAIGLLRSRNFSVFFVSSILICIPLAFYYQHANQFLSELHVANPTGKQTLGQVSEVLFMLLIPTFLKRFGMKVTLLVGMVAWTVRYLLFAFGNAGGLLPFLIVGIALHGVCYDFFFVSGQIFIDAKADKQVKTAAQGLITLATYGVGMLIGFWAAGAITDAYTVGLAHAWRSIWVYPAGFAAAVALLFAFMFKNETVGYGTT